MDHVIEEIKRLFTEKVQLPITGFEKIPQSGSDRSYFRILSRRDPSASTSKSFIITYGRNIRENDTFIYFSKHFRSAGCPTPQIFAVNEERTIYIQEKSVLWLLPSFAVLPNTWSIADLMIINRNTKPNIWAGFRITN